jgi:hypothetical protein
MANKQSQWLMRVHRHLQIHSHRGIGGKVPAARAASDSSQSWSRWQKSRKRPRDERENCLGKRDKMSFFVQREFNNILKFQTGKIAKKNKK